MDDGQFLMQRYYGSDEDLSQTEETGYNDKDKKLCSPPKKKRKHTDNKILCNDIESKKVNEDIVQKLNNSECNDNLHIKQLHETENSSDALGNKEDINEGPLKSKKKSHKKKKLCKSSPVKLETTLLSDSLEITDSDLNQTEAFPIIGQKISQGNEKIKPKLPEWLRNPTIIGIDLRDKEIPIEDLEYIDNCSKNNLKSMAINFLFPVQQAVIPWLMQANRRCQIVRPSDLCISAPTGSGKTLAFVIPIVQSLRNRVVCAVRALVVLPVSELAVQVYKVFENFVKGTDLKVMLLTGQKSFAAEQKGLVKKGFSRTLSLADIIVTTPGRILDHIHKTEGFSLQDLRYLVIDEADRMMEEIQKGWLKQIEDFVFKESQASGCICFDDPGERLSSIPVNACQLAYVNQPLQKLLYSATLTHDPEKLHTLSLFRPKLFVTRESDSTEWVGKCVLPEELSLQYIKCDSETKPIILCHFIKKYNFKKVLCFTESIERSQRLNFVLGDMGLLECREISSNYRPVQRKIVLDQFRSGKVNVIVCSDLVARGIDIEDIDCVISYDAPAIVKTFIHRIGRTARAGKQGTAVTLLTERDSSSFKKMINSAELSMPTEVKVDTSELSEYVECFQKALVAADLKIRKLKNDKTKKKCKKTTMKLDGNKNKL